MERDDPQQQADADGSQAAQRSTIPVVVPAQASNEDTVVISEWLVEPGANITKGQPIAEMETAKATYELESPATGTLLRTTHNVGDEVPVHSEIAYIEAADRVESGQRSDPPVVAKPEAPGAATSTAGSPEPAPGVGLSGGADPSGRQQAPGASPRARALASQRSIDIRATPGTGPDGMILARDLSDDLAQGQTGPVPVPVRGKALEPEPTGALASQPGARPLPVSRLRQAIGERMKRSLRESAQLTLTRRADASRLLDLRQRLRTARDDRLHAITLNDLLLFAAARCLLSHPRLNAHLEDGRIITFDTVHLGFAVDTPAGLLVPVISYASELRPAAIATRAAELAAQARRGRVVIREPATFTVSNLGPLGVESFTPIIDLPQVAILGVGAIRSAPGEKHADITLSLTIDHSVLDGADGARFLQELADFIGDLDTQLAR